VPEVKHPVKRSPLHASLTRAGASLREVSGWLVAENFGDARTEVSAVRLGVGLCDRSAAPKFELTAKDLDAAWGAVLGGDTPAAGRATAARWGVACRMSAQQAFLVLDEPGGSLPDEAAKDASPASCRHLVERTDGYGGLLLCGRSAPGVVRKLCALDVREEQFPDLSCAAAPLAGVWAVLVRRDRATLAGYEIFFSREYGDYLWNAVLEAGAEFDIRPFGLAAARLV